MQVKTHNYDGLYVTEFKCNNCGGRYRLNLNRRDREYSGVWHDLCQECQYEKGHRCHCGNEKAPSSKWCEVCINK